MPKICRPNNGTLINADFNANKSTFDIKFGGSKSNFDLNLNKNIEVIISHLRAELVPRRLQEFITINEESLTNNSYIYIDNYGEDAKFDIRELLNKIELVKVNDVDLPITDKSVNIIITKNGDLIIPDPSTGAINIEVPTRTSDLINDGDGTSIFATKEYVDEKIISGAVSDVYVDGVSVVNPANKIAEINLPYTAGNGLVLNNYEFSLDDLILECGTSTLNV